MCRCVWNASIGTQQYFPKLLAGLASGNPPDIFLMHEYEMTQFAHDGCIARFERPLFGAMAVRFP